MLLKEGGLLRSSKRIRGVPYLSTITYVQQQFQAAHARDLSLVVSATIQRKYTIKDKLLFRLPPSILGMKMWREQEPDPKPEADILGQSILAPDAAAEISCPEKSKIHIPSLSKGRRATISEDEDESPVVMYRLEALEKLQEKIEKRLIIFNKEVAALYAKHESHLAGLYDVRRQIITGEKRMDLPETKRRRQIEEKDAGVEGFWLGVLRNNPRIAPFVTREDEEALQYLVDVRAETSAEGDGFKILFQFARNPYFKHKFLVRTYKMSKAESRAAPVAFTGTDIKWLPGRNITIRKVPTTAAGDAGDPAAGDVFQETPADSFFHFFKSLEAPGNVRCMDGAVLQELAGVMALDYRLGCVLRDEVVPYALEQFLGRFEDDWPAVAASEDEDEEDGQWTEADEEYDDESAAEASAVSVGLCAEEERGETALGLEEEAGDGPVDVTASP